MEATLDYFLPYQLDWINDPTPLSIGEKSRRIGWTYADSYRAVERRVKNISNYYLSSADLTAGREYMDYCRMWCQVFNAVADYSEGDETLAIRDEGGRVVDERKIHTMTIAFQNGRKIVAGSSNPVFFRSKGGDAGGDEFAFHRDGRELFKAMHATALFWGYQLRLWSTHNGEGSFFNGCLRDSRSGKLKARVHRVTVLDAVEQGLVEKIKRLKARDEKARQEWLDELRSTCPDEETWNEEYLCIPSSGANALLSYDLIGACERSGQELPVVEDIRELAFNGPIYLGWDVARKGDLSLITGLGRIGDVFETRILKRFRNATYAVQEEYFNSLMADPRIKRACIDETGIGNMLAERAKQRWGSRVEGVTFTPAVKSDLAMPLLRVFEDRRIRVPNEAEMREGLHKVRKVVTTAGNVRFDASRDEAGHADEFWSMGLAYHAADDLRIPLPEPSVVKPFGW